MFCDIPDASYIVDALDGKSPKMVNESTDESSSKKFLIGHREMTYSNYRRAERRMSRADYSLHKKYCSMLFLLDGKIRRSWHAIRLCFLLRTRVQY